MRDDLNSLDARLRERRKLREQLNTERKYIVDTIFPAGAMHLIGGPSGIGKTTWLLQQLNEWCNGRDVLGHKTHPCPWVWVSCDRSVRETDATMRRIGLGEWDAPIYSIEETMGKNAVTGHLDGDPSIYKIVEHFPDAELIVIEGLQALLPDTARGRSSNKSELLWMIQVRDTILSKGKTIIATTHNPKSKQEYLNARSNFLGTQSFLGSCSTLVSFDLPREVREAGKGVAVLTTDREVAVLGRDFPDRYLSYTRKDNGSFELTAQVVTGKVVTGEVFNTSDDDRIALDTMLSIWPPGDISINQLKQWADKKQIHERQLERWIKEKVEQGRLTREKRGTYRKVTPS